MSAFTTGTVVPAAIASIRCWAKVRQTIAATCRSSTRAVSSIGSPRPSWLVWASTTSGLPPSSATPTANEIRVRVDGLSKISATVFGPSSGRCTNRSAFISAASSSTAACCSGLRSSSRRKCRVMRRSLSGCDEGARSGLGGRRGRLSVEAAVSSAAGRAARKASACSSVRISGGASRSTPGATALTRKPAARSASSAPLATSSVSTTPSSRPEPRTPATSGWPSASMPVRSRSPSCLAWPHRSSAAIVSSTASAAAQHTGLPPKVEPWLPGPSRSAASPKAMQAPIGRPPPSPLASVTTSGATPSAW